MGKNLVNAVKLPSSSKVFGHDDDSFEESVLVSLLEESCKRKLSNKTKIIITNEYMPNDVPEDICDSSYFKSKKEIISLIELKSLYKKIFHIDYSPEFEKERTRLEFADLEKQRERADAWGPWMYSARLENEKKELREIAKEKGFQYSF